MYKFIRFQDLETSIDSDKSKISPFYRFMPTGDMLLLGNVLLNYVHHLTRIVRDMAFIEAPVDVESVTVGVTKMTRAQIANREYLYLISQV